MARQYSRRGTGSIRNRGKSYQVRRTIDGRSYSFTGMTAGEAQSKANAFVPTRAVNGKSPTVRDWMAEWLTRKQKTLRSQTWMSYEQHARLHICPTIGGVRIDSITTAH